MLQQVLPAVNQRVDVWFDGYDEFYGGRVDSVTRPYKFHVILDDNSSWHMDTRKHVFRFSSAANQPQDSTQSSPVRRSSTANARKSVGSAPTSKPDLSAYGPTATRRTRARRASAPAPTQEEPNGLASDAMGAEKDQDAASKRRTSGRALRKNTAGPRPPPPPETVENSPSASARTESEAVVGDDSGSEVAGGTETDSLIAVELAHEDKNTDDLAPNLADKTFTSAAAAALAADAADERDNKKPGAVSFLKNTADSSVLSPAPSPPGPLSPSPLTMSSFSLHPTPTVPAPTPTTPPVSTRRTSARTTPRTTKAQQEDEPKLQLVNGSNENTIERPRRGRPGRPRKNPPVTEAQASKEAEIVQSATLAGVGRKRGPPSVLSDSASDDDGSKGGQGQSRVTKKRRLATRANGVDPGDPDVDVVGEEVEASLTSSPPSPAALTSPSRRRASVTFRDEVEIFATPRYEHGALAAKVSKPRSFAGEQDEDQDPNESESETETEGERDMLGGSTGQDGQATSLENVNAKVITALAVDAALEAVKTVVEPLNERVENLLRELGTVSRELVTQKKQLETELSATVSALNAMAEASQKAGESKGQEKHVEQEQCVALPNQVPLPAAVGEQAGGPSSNDKEKMSGISQAVTISALQNFQLDVSEVIGGGEARLRMHASLSQQEFESLHRLIEHQGKSLSELDRLLYAAQKFAEKAEDEGVTAGGAVADAGKAQVASKKTQDTAVVDVDNEGNGGK